MKNWILSVVILTALFFSVAISCNREVNVKDVSLDRTSISLKVGQSTTLVATVTPEKATNKAVVFSSNNILVATVLPTGLVTGISKGTTTIVATTVDGGFIATCYVTVKEDAPDVPVEGVTLNKTELAVPVGGKETLIATVLPDSATNKKVTFSSSDATAASVDAQGVVTGKKEGSAIITVTTVEGGFTAKCDVTVGEVPVTGVKVNKKTLELYTLEKEQLTAQIIPANATNKKVFWSSSNPYVAEVNEETGMVLAKTEGKADITVKTDDGNFTDKCNVTVTKKIYVTGVSLNKSSITLGIGNAEQLIATVQPYNATNKKVIWSSSSSEIASVDTEGLVTAVSNGDAIITVTTDESSFTANCSVKCIAVTNPALTTTAATNISYTSATLNGNISNAGNPAYSERGFVYSSVVSVPTLYGGGCDVTVATGTGTGNYSKNVTLLDQDKTYYVRAYVKNEMVGVTYGNVVNFKTLKDVSNISQVRFKKTKAYQYVTEMTVDKASGGELAGYVFGTSAGTSPYYDIPPGNHKLWYYYTYPGNVGWNDEGLHNFQKGRKYTFTCDDDGSYLIFYVTDDGPLKSSEPGIPYKPTTQVIKVQKNNLPEEKPKAIVN